MRFLTTLIILGGLGYGLYWLNGTYPELKDEAIELVKTGTFQTLETRFTASQIMEKEKLSLSNSSDARGHSPVLRFHPYLLMEVKFTTSDDQTEEGIILWDLMDGEMVLNTKSWEKTHGFADCINANADQNEYSILMTIAKNGGKASHQNLMQALNTEAHLFERALERARKKKLIVQQGNDYRIHLNHPIMDVLPSTTMLDPLVIKSSKHSERMQRQFSPGQIKRAAEAAFGANFAIRSAQDVFLPIYSMTIQHPDGSLHTTHWNAFNGKRVYYLSLKD